MATQTNHEPAHAHLLPLSFTIQGAMNATGLGRSKIYELINQQRLVRIHIGRRTLITGESLRALIGGAA